MFRKIIAIVAALAALPASAAVVDYGTYFQDTNTGIYWLKLNETRGMAYDDVTSQLVVGGTFEGWRYATLAEVENFIAAYGFPNQGRDCGDGWGSYCDSVSAGNAELLEDLIRLFGDTLDAGFDESGEVHDVAPDGAGVASGLLGLRGDPGGQYYYHVYEAILRDAQMVERATGLPAYDQSDAIQTRWDTGPSYGSSTVGSFLVRTTDPATALADPNDPNTLALTLFDNLSPDEAGLSAACLLCTYDAYEWQAGAVLDYTGTYIWGDFELKNSAFDQEARPWVRMTGYDYSAGGCQAGDTDLGAGWCRKEQAAAPFELMPPPGVPSGPYQQLSGAIPGTAVDLGDNFSLDNVTLEFINSNIQIDFEQWDAADLIRPKEVYFTTVGVKSLSVANGDAVDFDATQVDPGTVMIGPGRAPNVALPQQYDFDGDGDTDIVFGFRVEDSGVSCLDTSLTLVAKTFAGEPLAGQTAVTPINCEETIDVDVDPFNAVNVIRPDDSYNVTVAILGMRTADGDAVDVMPGSGSADDIDAASLRFGPAETGNSTAPIITDIDGDTHADMLVGFNAFDAGIACEDTELEITGEKVSGIPVEAFDSIQTEGCETVSCHP